MRASFFFDGDIGAWTPVRVWAAEEIGWERFSGCDIHAAASPTQEIIRDQQYRLTWLEGFAFIIFKYYILKQLLSFWCGN